MSGLVVGGVLAAVLSIVDVPLSTIIGAFVGGAVAAYVLYGKIGEAVTAGAIAGILGTPFYLGLGQILLVFEIIPIPAGPNPPMSELQGQVVILLLTNLVAGAAGAAIGGTIHRRKPEMEGQAPMAPAGPAGPARFCVQCGAQLPAGALVCPQCNARQPQ